MRRAWFLLALGFLLPVPSLRAEAPWHSPGWHARAVVEITKTATEPGVDTAGVKVLCQGRANPDGSDYRVVGPDGKAVPFQLTFHDAARYSLISFRAANTKGKYFVYFDNARAARAPEQVVADPAPSSGAPALLAGSATIGLMQPGRQVWNGLVAVAVAETVIKPGAPKGVGPDRWLPRYGFVLQTMERPKGDNPRTVADMAKLMAGSKAKYGGRYQRRVAEGYNHFGPSDYYISVYRGWVRVPKDGKYQFCTISNEASFSFLDGKELIHWPGRHTVDRGARGEVNTSVQLKAGLHYLEYYHEEVTLDQMAYLGWRPSADVGPFSPIPESFYTAPHEATVVRYQGPKSPLLRFEPTITDSVWLAERSEGQYTRATFAAGKAPALPEGTTYEWDFGDGQKATGATAEHVYLTLGNYTVTLTAKKGAQTWTASWPLLIFELEHVTDQFKEGKPKDYAKLVKSYDRTKLGAEALKELAYLLAESEDPAGAMAAGREFVKRFAAKGEALQVARVRRLMADCAIRAREGSLDEAIKNYQASLVKEVPPVERLEVLGQLTRLIGIERNLPEKGMAVLAQVEKIVKGIDLEEDTRKAYRRALVAAGDVRLWQGKRTEAQKLYARAEKERRKAVPPQVRNALIGAHPNSLREYLRAGNYGAALDLVDQWDDMFPTDKFNGHSVFWRGKVLALRGQPREAARYLGWAVKLGPGASWETEGRWLLAGVLEQLGRTAEARKELAKLVATGLKDEYTRKAGEKLLKK
jgi:hypothetical protein